MNILSLQTIPQPDFRVRRRKLDGVSWLIHENRYHELDALADSIWQECDGRATLQQIAERIAERKGMPPGEALSATLLGLMLFRHVGLVEWQEELT